MRYRTIPTADLRSLLDDAINWFEQVLRRSIASSRLAEIRDTLGRFDQPRSDLAQRAGIAEHLDDVTAYSSWTDALAFVRVWSALRDLSDQVLPRRLLWRAIQGPLSPAAETLDNSDSRNILAQLEFAADLSLKGLRPLGFEDLEFDHRSCRYIAECKRPWSSDTTAVMRNLAKCYEQLHGALERSASRVRRGLVVFVIDRIADLNLRLPEETPVRGEEDVHALVQDVFRWFDDSYIRVARTPTDRRIIALVLVVRTLVHTLQDNTFGAVYVPVFIPLVGKATKDYKRLSRLARQLKASGGVRSL